MRIARGLYCAVPGEGVGVVEAGGGVTGVLPVMACGKVLRFGSVDQRAVSTRLPVGRSLTPP